MWPGVETRSSQCGGWDAFAAQSRHFFLYAHAGEYGQTNTLLPFGGECDGTETLVVPYAWTAVATGSLLRVISAPQYAYCSCCACRGKRVLSWRAAAPRPVHCGDARQAQPSARYQRGLRTLLQCTHPVHAAALDGFVEVTSPINTGVAFGLTSDLADSGARGNNKQTGGTAVIAWVPWLPKSDRRRKLTC